MEKYLPLVVVRNAEETKKVLQGLLNKGLHMAEITFRTDYAEDAIRYACDAFPQMEVGAGTVIDGGQCERAIAAGAKFIVSPGLSEKVADVCKKHGIPYYPGCVTPTEIMHALELGISTVKFFPAGVYGGVKAIKALSGPFPQVKFIPTGGVNESNAEEYLSLQNVAAVSGSFLTEGLAEGDK